MSWDKELRLYSLINIASQCLFYSFCQSNKSVSGDIVVPQSDVRQSPGQARQAESAECLGVEQSGREAWTIIIVRGASQSCTQHYTAQSGGTRHLDSVQARRDCGDSPDHDIM